MQKKQISIASVSLKALFFAHDITAGHDIRYLLGMVTYSISGLSSIRFLEWPSLKSRLRCQESQALSGTVKPLRSEYECTFGQSDDSDLPPGASFLVLTAEFVAVNQSSKTMIWAFFQKLKKTEVFNGFHLNKSA